MHPVVRARQCQAHPQILHAGPSTKFVLLESQTFKQQGVADLQLLVKARSFSAWLGTPVQAGPGAGRAPSGRHLQHRLAIPAENRYLLPRWREHGSLLVVKPLGTLGALSLLPWPPRRLQVPLTSQVQTELGLLGAIALVRIED